MNFNVLLQDKVNEVDDIVKSFLPEEKGYQQTVLKAMNYSVLAGGKRLRPLLMQEIFKLFSGNGEVVRPFMAAMEMIHTYSLVHDDLPAMDNDEYRRGRKTTHVVFGEAMGILAGDALLNYAYETAIGAFSYVGGSDGADAGRIINALKVLGRKAGIYGMVGGQVKDVEATENNEQIDKDTLQFIYNLKTGALLEGSMVIGAILAGASGEDIKKTENIASKIGMAFQIQDDILDVIGSVEALGKPIGSDDKNNKATYVSLYGLENAKAEVIRLTNEAVDLLQDLPGEKDFLKELLLWLVNREK
ncbi:MAG: polyprenyl synthetase family protein [Lachnospiraceae bacterium]|nr:polyprenyl synthetase family protein [Lachnospiraceae bacterium]